MKEFKLYHYSNKMLDSIKTREAQGIIPSREDLKGQQKTKDFWNKPGLYDQHISFFLEPIPLDILGDIYGKEHHTWFPGNEFYEYVVLLSDIGEFGYELVETPRDVEMFYDPKYERTSMKEYAAIRNQYKVKYGEKGNDRVTFMKVASSMQGLTRSCYEQINQRPNWGEIKKLYAATVPHVMLYPKDGVVKYQSVRKVKIPKTSISTECLTKSFLAKW